jgi:hypothetical protein
LRELEVDGTGITRELLVQATQLKQLTRFTYKRLAEKFDLVAQVGCRWDIFTPCECCYDPVSAELDMCHIDSINSFIHSSWDPVDVWMCVWGGGLLIGAGVFAMH